MGHVKFLTFAQLRRDSALQSRVAMDPELVGEYTDAILRGDRMPPIKVVFDRTYYHLVDGWHRCEALEAAGKCEVEAEVIDGTYRDALLASFAANSKNGARRTNADKRQAVKRMLADDEWATWSDNEIAKRCAVSQPFVSSVRSSLKAVISEKSPEHTYTTKHGTRATMHTASIGRKARTFKPRGEVLPPASPRDNEHCEQQQRAPSDPEVATVEIDAAHFSRPKSDQTKEIERLEDYVAKLEQRIRERDKKIKKLKGELEDAKHEIGALMRGHECRRRGDRAALTNEVTLESSRSEGA